MPAAGCHGANACIVQRRNQVGNFRVAPYGWLTLCIARQHYHCRFSGLATRYVRRGRVVMADLLFWLAFSAVGAVVGSEAWPFWVFDKARPLLPRDVFLDHESPCVMRYMDVRRRPVLGEAGYAIRVQAHVAAHAPPPCSLWASRAASII